MEAATKLIYQFSELLWDPELTYMAHKGLTARWWTPAYKRETKTPVITCYVTSERAKVIDQMSEEEASYVGLKELSILIGKPFDEVSSKCVAFKRISWAKEKFTQGGYAHAPKGFAWARKVLGEPEHDCLYFAGEAIAIDSNPQTVHGAINSGITAAKQCSLILSKL